MLSGRLWRWSDAGRIGRDERPQFLSMFADEGLEGWRNDDAGPLWIRDDLAALGDNTGEYLASRHSLRSTVTTAWRDPNDDESVFPAHSPVIPLFGKKLSGFGSPDGSGMGSPRWRSAGTPCPVPRALFSIQPSLCAVSQRRFAAGFVIPRCLATRAYVTSNGPGNDSFLIAATARTASRTF